MDAASVVLMAKIARKEAGRIVPKVESIAAKIAEKVARSIIPAKGDAGYAPIKGKDYFDGKDGYAPIKDVDYFDGKDGYTPKKGKDYNDGAAGKSANEWHLLYDEPDEDFGSDGDFALDGKTSNIYHKAKGQWDFVTHLKAEVPSMQMQAPRAYSPEQIREIAGVAVAATELYHLIDEDSEEAVKYYGFGKDDSQGHYIEKVDTSSAPIAYRVSLGASDYATDWTNRVSLTYSRRTEVNIP
jgi:hypothetical protein